MTIKNRGDLRPRQELFLLCVGWWCCSVLPTVGVISLRLAQVQRRWAHRPPITYL